MTKPLSEPPLLGCVRLPHGEDLPLPAYETPGAAGMDIRAAVPADKPMTIRRGARMLVPTGFVIEIPPGYEIQVRPRSGLAFKHGITCLNTPGTIDSDYRGEVQKFVVERGMRIAQGVLAPVVRIAWEETDSLPPTGRGAGGFGSTGVG
eukprot:gene34673-46536_t